MLSLQMCVQGETVFLSNKINYMPKEYDRHITLPEWLDDLLFKKKCLHTRRKTSHIFVEQCFRLMTAHTHPQLFPGVEIRTTDVAPESVRRTPRMTGAELPPMLPDEGYDAVSYPSLIIRIALQSFFQDGLLVADTLGDKREV